MINYGVAVMHYFTPRNEDKRTTTRRMCIIPAFNLNDAQHIADTMNRHLEGSREDKHGMTSVNHEVVGQLYTNGVNGHAKITLSLSEIVTIADAFTAPDRMAAE